MIRSRKARARQGERYCPCATCSRPLPSRTARTRERRTWRRDQEASR